MKVMPLVAFAATILCTGSALAQDEGVTALEDYRPRRPPASERPLSVDDVIRRDPAPTEAPRPVRPLAPTRPPLVFDESPLPARLEPVGYSPASCGSEVPAGYACIKSPDLFTCESVLKGRAPRDWTGNLLGTCIVRQVAGPGPTVRRAYDGPPQRID